MILRSWGARAPIANSAAFLHTFRSTVLPHMSGFEGCRGCYLLSREENDQVHVQVLSLWNSLEAITKFAGTDALAAVVSPAVAELMTDYDTEVRHDTVVVDTVTGQDGIPAAPNRENGS